jgi:NTE family protein
MSGPAGWLPDVYAASRRHAARLLKHEVRALQRAGTRTVVFAPGVAEQRAMGNDMMSRHDLGGVIQQSFLTAGAYAATPEVAGLLRAAADPRSR